MAKEDPRTLPGAYVSQGPRLYEVMKASSSMVTLENCLTGACLSVYRDSIVGRHSTYKLVKATPAVADSVPDDLVGAA